ncbi:MAG: MopE-related protein [Candidatus Electrothrix aestuarii]|uniref:MopE-related protein n=1 Tax=Candidatus Electrothrix aestuarii TaxID=3062594 RepID=A0AAU8LY87_9BACT
MRTGNLISVSHVWSEGVCQRSGVKVCSADGSGTECNAIPGSPSPELCNGQDDDCDGVVDENWQFDLGVACVVGGGMPTIWSQSLFCRWFRY